MLHKEAKHFFVQSGAQDGIFSESGFDLPLLPLISKVFKLPQSSTRGPGHLKSGSATLVNTYSICQIVEAAEILRSYTSRINNT